MPNKMVSPNRRRAIRFIIFLGCISLFADMTYEGARSINGPYLQVLGATGTVVGIAAGFGELVGYGLRWISGYFSDRTRKYWAIVIAGYLINLLSVPLLAWAGYWQVAVILMIAERAGKAVRSPTKDAMLSHASSQVGHGWGFGLHEFMDQVGATVGPLLVSAVLFYKQDQYRTAYLLLFIPAVCSLTLLWLARISYPDPSKLSVRKLELHQAKGFPAGFVIYVIGAMCLAAGYADYPLIAFHFKQNHLIRDAWIPALYAMAMLTEGISSLIMGKLYDKLGLWTLLGVTALTIFFAPMVFGLNIHWAIIGMILWGLGMGAQASILKAVVSGLIPPDKKATAFGLFDTFFGIAWFAGSALMGYLYDISLKGLIAFSMAMQLGTIIFLLIYMSRSRRQPVPAA
jgi:MFS family permease